MRDIINEEDKFNVIDEPIEKRKSLELLEEKGLIELDDEKDRVSVCDKVHERYYSTELRKLIEWVDEDRDFDYKTYRLDILVSILLELGIDQIYIQELVSLDWLIEEMQETDEQETREIFEMGKECGAKELVKLLEIDPKEISSILEERDVE